MTVIYPEYVFEEDWHGHLFALTVYLNEAGHFSWVEWSEKFGASLKKLGLENTLNGGNDYFTAWLGALETFLTELNMANQNDLARIKQAWEKAYLNTPHGKTVSLK